MKATNPPAKSPCRVHAARNNDSILRTVSPCIAPSQTMARPNPRPWNRNSVGKGTEPSGAEADLVGARGAAASDALAVAVALGHRHHGGSGRRVRGRARHPLSPATLVPPWPRSTLRRVAETELELRGQEARQRERERGGRTGRVRRRD